jgi:AraC-like DNA-binding protein
LRPPRTSLSVRRRIETITCERAAWRFRPHYHTGDEIVQLTAGRARLRLPDAGRDVEAGEAGETIVVPAGTVHRFEPVDAEGWAFTSEFAVRADGAGARPVTHNDGRLVVKAIELLTRRQGLRSDSEALARACRVSSGHLARTFQRVTGTGLHNFHVLLVLQKAKTLVRGGEPLAAAAFDSGFYDQAHLTREFVRTYGFTPKAFQLAWSGPSNSG